MRTIETCEDGMHLRCDHENAGRRGFLLASLRLAVMAAIGDFAAAAHAAGQRQIEAKWMTFDSQAVAIPAYVATPLNEDPRAIVTILHGAFGIPTDIQEITRDVAHAGFIGFALDATARYPAPGTLGQDFLMGETFIRQIESDTWAGVETLAGRQQAKPVVMLGFGEGGYTSLRAALNAPARVGAVIALYSALNNAQQSRTDPRPSLIDLLPSLEVPAQFHIGTADANFSRDHLQWLRQLVERNPTQRQLFLYRGAGHGFYQSGAATFDRGYQQLARNRWQQFVTMQLQ